MTRRLPIWNGTQKEAELLTQSIAHNCTCTETPAAFGVPPRKVTCPAHSMLLEDQRTLDRLLFARYLAVRLIRQEFNVGQPQETTPEVEASWLPDVQAVEDQPRQDGGAYEG